MPASSLPFFSINSDLCNAWVTAVLYKISCYIGSCYNGTQLSLISSCFAEFISGKLFFELTSFSQYWGDAYSWNSASWISFVQASLYTFNTLRPRQNGCHFADDVFKGIFFNGNITIPIKISLKFVPKGLINNIPALVLIMAWRRPGDKPLSEPMLVRSLTHICITRPQWVKDQSFQWKMPPALWRHQMEIFSTLLCLCMGNPPVTGGFP